MTTLPVYAYFNVDQLARLMDAIAAITGSGDFRDIFRLVSMLVFLVLVAGVAIGKSQEPFEFFRWLIIVALVHSVLLVPKIDVLLMDRSGTNPPLVRSNVPIGLAFFASLTSHVGDSLTRTFEAVFALPDEMQFQKTGMMFGNTVLVDSLQAVPTTPSFRDDLTKFISNCTYYDIIAGRILQDDFAKSDDVWSMMSHTSNTLSTPITTSPSGSMLCSDAHADLTSRWDAETTKTMQTRGRVLNPGAPTSVAAGAMLSVQIASSYATLTTIAKSATDMLRQNMTLNSIRDSQMVAAQRLDATSAAIIGAAQAQSELTANTNFMVMARVAERAAPGIRNVIELICYAVFPLVLLLLIVAGEHAGKVIKYYVMSLVWVQLIPPLYAILNFAMTTASRHNLVGIAESSTAAAVNLVNIGQLSQRGLSDAAIAGFLTLSLPLIAAALVKTGEVGGASLFNAVFTPAASSASHVAGNLAAGNVNQGNVSLDTTTSNNLNANHYDTAPSIATGYTRLTTASGTTLLGADGVYRFQANQSVLGFSANFGQKIGNALSSEAAERQEIADRESAIATQMRTAALVERMGIQKAFAEHHGTNSLDDATQSSRSSKAVAELQQIAENVNKKLGLAASNTVGQRIVGILATGGRVSTEASVGLPAGLPIGGKVSVSAEASINSQKIDDASRQKVFDAAINYARDQLHSKNVTTEQALSSDFRSSEAYTWGQQNRIESVRGEESAMTSAIQHARNAETSRSEAFSLSHQARTVTESWLHSSMNYEGYLAKRLHEDGKLDAFNMLYQSNPEQAARLAAAYLAQTNFDVMPTPQQVSANLKDVQGASPALAGRTITAESDRVGHPPDQTVGAKQVNDGSVRARGFEEQDVANHIHERVKDAEAKVETGVNNAESGIRKQIATDEQTSKTQLDRKKQIPGLRGPSAAPPEGSAAEHQDRVHKDLFNPSYDKKPK